MYNLQNKQVRVNRPGRPGTPGRASGERPDWCVAGVTVVTNVGLISQRRHKGLDFHRAGPLLFKRITPALLIGEAREKIRASWRLFTSCAVKCTLLEEVNKVAENAVPGDVLLLSPACSSFDQSRNYQHRSGVFRQTVTEGGNGNNIPLRVETN